MSSTTMEGAEAQQETCLACGVPVYGPYCHSCGQKNDDCRRSIVRLGAETIANVAALDGKFLRTIRSSLVRPGSHVHQYAHGRRSPFTPPVRFFFVVTFAFFATLWLTDRNIFVLQLVPEGSDTSESMIDFNVSEEEVADGIASLPDEPFITLGEQAATLDEAEAPPEPAPVPAEPEDIDRVEPAENTTDLSGEIGALVEGLASGVDEEELAEIEERIEEARGEGPRIVPYGGFLIKAHDLTYTEEEKEWLRSRVSVGEGFTFLGREMTSERLGDALIQTMQNPAAFNNALNEIIPFLMLLFVPLMAVLGTLFIRGKDALVYDHLLLAIQTHAFAFVVMTLTIWTGFFLPSEAGALAFLIGVPLYYVMGLRGAFHRSWAKSIVTTVFVGFVYHSLFFFALLAAMVASFWQIV